MTYRPDHEPEFPIKGINSIQNLKSDNMSYSKTDIVIIEKIGNLDVNVGTIVAANLLRQVKDKVIVTISKNIEGTIPISEFTNDEEIVPGKQVSVFVESTEVVDGRISVSKEKAKFHTVWHDIKFAFDEHLIVKGDVIKRTKGGLTVSLMGLEAFLPESQVALRQVPNLEKFCGQAFDFRVIKLNKKRRNIVVSIKQVLEEARSELKEALIKELAEEQVRVGIVKNITDFGAFVDLGGIDGLLHITDMSWGRVRHPSQLLTIGQEIEVKVLKFDKDRERISLGLKQLQTFPWEGVAERYAPETIVNGKVASITDYGAFVEIEPGVEGLIHISEMSWTKHVRHPGKILNVGDDIEAVVLSVNEEERKISLSLESNVDDERNYSTDHAPLHLRKEPDFTPNKSDSKCITAFSPDYNELVTIIELLGGRTLIGMNLNNQIDLLNLTNNGISKASLLSLRNYIGFTTHQIAEILPIAESTIKRYKLNQAFKPMISEHILHFAQVVTIGINVFLSKKTFLKWMASPSTALGNRVPKHLMKSHFGMNMVIEELARIEHGIVS